MNQREGDTSLTSSPFVRPLVSPWSGGYQSGQSVGFSSSFTYLIFLLRKKEKGVGGGGGGGEQKKEKKKKGETLSF